MCAPSVPQRAHFHQKKREINYFIFFACEIKQFLFRANELFFLLRCFVLIFFSFHAIHRRPERFEWAVRYKTTSNSIIKCTAVLRTRKKSVPQKGGFVLSAFPQATIERMFHLDTNNATSCFIAGVFALLFIQQLSFFLFFVHKQGFLMLFVGSLWPSLSRPVLSVSHSGMNHYRNLSNSLWNKQLKRVRK